MTPDPTLTTQPHVQPIAAGNDAPPASTPPASAKVDGLVHFAAYTPPRLLSSLTQRMAIAASGIE